MREEEIGHRQRLTDLYRERFGDHIPLIRREDVKGFVRRQPPWMVMPRGLDAMRCQAAVMELETTSPERAEHERSERSGRGHSPDVVQPAERRKDIVLRSSYWSFEFCWAWLRQRSLFDRGVYGSWRAADGGFEPLVMR